jgi:uncharacterized protein
VLWWVGAVVITALLTWGLASDVPDPIETAAEIQNNFAVFTESGYLAQLPTRLSLFIDIVIANLVGVPLAVALMLTGMLAHRAGWLADRTAIAWRTALAIGLALGLPAALVYGGLQYIEADMYRLGAYSAVAAVPGVISVALAFAYAATFFMYAPSALVRWLAPAGRMPLTNYLMQSIAMGALLSGWGLALAPRLGYTQLSLLAAAIFCAQLLASRWWLQRWSQGPLERLWRRWTYHRMAPVTATPELRSGE